MRQRVETASRLRVIFAAMWARIWWELHKQPEEKALATYSPVSEELASARDEVEAMAPWSAGQWEVDQPKGTSTRLTLALLFISVPVVIACLIGVPQGPPVASHTCTFEDGTRVDGQCMFIDEFNGSALSASWQAPDDWNGPLQNIAPDISCFRHENCAVSGGNLRLTMSANARGSCPQTWSATSYYTSNYGASWPPGQATSYDVCVVSQPSFRFKYGRVQMRITLPPGRGPGGDVSLWGIGCQRPAGIINALGDLFQYPAGQRACDWPNIGHAEMDIIQSSRTGATTVINTSVYTASSPGSPSLVDTFFGINYYGARWAQPATGGFTTWMGPTISNPTSSYHVYELLWTPTRWSVYVDGNIQALENPGGTTWIPSALMFVMFWNATTVAVTPGDLPSVMLVDYIRITCPPGVPCEWSGA